MNAAVQLKYVGSSSFKGRQEEAVFASLDTKIKYKYGKLAILRVT